MERDHIGVDDVVAGVLRDIKDSGKRLVAVTNTNKTHQLVWIHRFAGELAVFSTVCVSDSGNPARNWSRLAFSDRTGVADH